MMKKMIVLAMIMVLSFSLVGCKKTAPEEPVVETPQQTEKADQQAISNLVENFGKKLQAVPLLASQEVAAQSMKDNYGSFVSPALLAKWQQDPANAPGRTVSSPWPERIEILSMEKISADDYQVKGNIIEITSEEKANGGAAATRPIALEVKRSEKQWLIEAAVLGDYPQVSDAIVYKNADFGFSFDLPKSWQGYTIVTGKWEGRALGGTDEGKIIETGPIISIRHPLWTVEIPRQDIPIMIYTLSQWTALVKEEFSVGAAPIPPSEIGRNAKFVFALPARYNFAFPAGFEEVETIMQSKPLQPIK